MKAAVIFDLDGTLIDSAPDVRAALNRLLAIHGRRSLELAEVHSLVGEGPRPLISGAWRLTGAAAAEDRIDTLIQEYLTQYRAHPTDHTVVFDGVEAMLAQLRQLDCGLGICTNKPSMMTDLVLAALNLEQYFDAIVGGDYHRRKPDGDHILESARRMKAHDVPLLYIGDSVTDVAAARSAGLAVFCVDWGYSGKPASELGADGLISRFSDLPDMVARWLAKELLQ